MKIIMFYHSMVSDWNHGNAHFLRGIVSERGLRGHQVEVYEARHNWSLSNLKQEHGDAPIRDFAKAYPELTPRFYDNGTLDTEAIVADADLVIVHEWNDPDLVAKIGKLRKKHPFRLLFHDTHHRLVTAPEQMLAYDLSHYDGVLAFGAVLRDLYLSRGLAKRAWTWHEAADTRLFRPRPGLEPEADLVWIGNWGDEERSEELHEFLIRPVRELGLRASVYGVRYPEKAKRALHRAGIVYRGWLPNFMVPEVFARHRVTVHVPRRPYVRALPGIPTIRPFEALACGIPLVCAPWEDAETLFSPGPDYLTAADGNEMKACLARLLADTDAARTIAARGLGSLRGKHTCAHRVDELLKICGQLRPKASPVLS
jgi:spore maturation protein CgeB